ncbi:hypothetical protein HGRIS_008436 [Hohenbuehelia grisea]|uniref:Uncharacterized protein n=1 Tax=Hohenbuehelia grisea TaxID=104357 RepID=A0ABR3J7Y8_9AGAR
MSTGAIAGIAVGIVAFLILLAAIVWLMFRQRKVMRKLHEKAATYRAPLDDDDNRYSPVATGPSTGFGTASSVVPFTVGAPTEYTIPSEYPSGSTSVPSTYGPSTPVPLSAQTHQRKRVANAAGSGGTLDELHLHPGMGAPAASSSGSSGSAYEDARSLSAQRPYPPEKRANEPTVLEHRPPSPAMSASGFSDAPPAYS